MTVKELKEALNKFPDHMQVFMAERTTPFAYGLLNSAKSKTINFQEEPDSKVLAKSTVVILDEE